MVRPNVFIPDKALAEFSRQHGIACLSLFGSVLRDVGVLVEFLPATRVSLFDMAAMQLELSRYFCGRVLAEAEVQYAV